MTNPEDRPKERIIIEAHKTPPPNIPLLQRLQELWEGKDKDSYGFRQKAIKEFGLTGDEINPAGFERAVRRKTVNIDTAS